MEPLLLLALSLVALGAWLQGSVGFGMNLTAAPLLIAVDPRFVPGPLLVAAATLTLMTLLRERSHASPRRIAWAFAGRVPGSVLGAWAITVLSADGLALVLSVTVLAAVAASVWGPRVEITRPSLVVAGSVSGFTGTTTAVGGPPIALLFQHETGPSVRANLAGFFVLGTVLSITLLTVAGDFGAAEARLSLLTIPPVLLGFGASMFTRRHVDGPRVRPAVLTLAGVSAAWLLVRTIVG